MGVNTTRVKNKMNDMKLIMESWRSYTVEQNSSLDILKENADKGLITEERLAELWLQSLDDDWNQMINEGVIDALKKGVEAVKKGGKFIADKIMAAYSAAANKINEWITRLYIGGLDILQRTIKKVTSFGPVQKFISGMSALVEKIKDFKYDHPILFKVVTVAALVAVVAAVLYLMAGEANAKIEHPNNPKAAMQMSGAEDTWQGAKGICTAVLENSDDPEVQNMAKGCVRMINDYSPGGVFEHDVLRFSKEGSLDSKKLIQIAGKWFEGMEDKALSKGNLAVDIKAQWVASGSPGPGTELYNQANKAVADANEAFKLTNDLVKVGKESTYKTLEIWNDGFGSSSIKIGGGISKMQGLEEPAMAQARGIGMGQSIAKSLAGK
jgi:hypothetical protein